MNRRNTRGLKDSVYRYRTFSDGRYIGWLTNPTNLAFDLYRQAGVRCRRVDGEMFIHLMDEDDARHVYKVIESQVLAAGKLRS
jgi:hypothetical protein